MPNATETRYRLIESIVGDLHRIHKSLHRYIGWGLQGLPVTPAQALVLRMIKRQPGTTVSEMARRGMMTKSNISVLVDRLCREGLLEKKADQTDQRLTRLYLTAGGQKILAEIAARHMTTTRAALAGLNDEQLARVADSMQLLLRTLNTNPACRGDE